jgi:dolichyl-phosphate beta-glucosyltransferase
MTESGEKRVKLSVVIPAYNEAHRLGATLERVSRFIGSRPGGGEIIVVDDGSKDRTAELVRSFNSGGAPLRVFVNESNHGKGYSVRRGMLEATGDVLLMYDADGSTPIEEVDKLLPWIEQGFGVAIGSREMRDSVLDPPQPLIRRMMKRMFTAVRRVIMLPDLIDTQCGFKAFSRAAALDVFPQQQEQGFGFDCEALLQARLAGHRIKEVGILWRDDRQSTVRPVPDSIKMIASMIRVRRRLRKRQDGASRF